MMNDDVAISVSNVSKSFCLPHEKMTSVKGLLVNVFRHKKGYEEQHVLKGISVEVKKGEFFGIVGRNGSGKSTMLKLLAGIYNPDKGNISINGSLTPFIELGVGFNPELTGRENVYLNGALLGFTRKEMKDMYKDIVSFAELERFMDQKLKNYSSGMQVRLAFSIAIRANSDILLLDEVLAVGDAIFQQKCFDYFKELKKRHKTVILVSHDASALQQYCDRGILVEGGKIIQEGPIKDVVNQYRHILTSVEESQTETKKSGEKRWGNREVEVVSAKVFNDNKKKQQIFNDNDPIIRIDVNYRAKSDCEQPIFGITINDEAGDQVFASNTAWTQVETTDLQTGEQQQVVWKVPNVFNNGTYLVSPAVANDSGAVMYDWRDGFISFKIRKKLESTAQINVAHELEVVKNNPKRNN